MNKAFLVALALSALPTAAYAVYATCGATQTDCEAWDTFGLAEVRQWQPVIWDGEIEKVGFSEVDFDTLGHDDFIIFGAVPNGALSPALTNAIKELGDITDNHDSRLDALEVAPSFTNGASRSLTTGTGGTGFQVSATRNAVVNYSVTIATAVQIGVVTNVDGYVVLEIAPTNSATAGDWIEIARAAQAQNIGLAVALSSTQKGGGNLTGIVPAGWYAKIRTVNLQGTPAYTYNSGQEVLF